MEISFQRLIDTIDGNIQSQGIKVRFPAWMVIGSPEWEITPERIKAYAYQAAKTTGWSDESLINAVTAAYKHIDKHMAKFTIETLKILAEEYKLEVIEDFV
jgi:hypothetical protein